MKFDDIVVGMLVQVCDRIQHTELPIHIEPSDVTGIIGKVTHICTSCASWGIIEVDAGNSVGMFVNNDIIRFHYKDIQPLKEVWNDYYEGVSRCSVIPTSIYIG